MNISSVSPSGPVDPSDLQASSKQRRLDFQALASDLQSGDISSAQQAFAQLQKDSPRLAQALNSPPSSSDSPRITDLKSLASALKSGDISSAQQAFAKLQQDAPAQSVKGGHHHHHHSAPVAPAPSGDSTGNDGSSTVGSVINASA